MARLNSIFKAKVMHHRLMPFKNKFIYKQYYVFLKAQEPFKSDSPLLSINRLNLFSFYYKKYGNRNGVNPYFFAQNLLNEYAKDTHWLQDIYVLTQPSLLGWAFNPVSFWFYFDADHRLRAVLSEVNNTFGEHHKYFVHLDNFAPIEQQTVLRGRKVFYVSPFFKVEGTYDFRFYAQDNTLGVWITYRQDEIPVLQTALTGTLKPLTSASLLGQFFKIPFSNLKTVILIHFQALKLWFKGAKYIKRNKHESTEVTRCQ